MSRDIGQKFVNYIVKDDFEALSKLLDEEIVFTAATPGDTWHGEGIKNAMVELRNFFSPDEAIEKIVTIEHNELPGRSRISYKLQGREKEFGVFEYEHQAYFQTEDNKISQLRILCSGLYTPEE